MPNSARSTRSARLEQEFLRAQQLAPAMRGSSFEALFLRHLQHVCNQIHHLETLDEILLEPAGDIAVLLNADRASVYAVSEDRSCLIGKSRTGLNTSRTIKLAIGAEGGIAGCVAARGELANIADVYDQAQLRALGEGFSFSTELDRQSGYRTRQMLVAPILGEDQVLGIVQVINSRTGEPFGELEVDGIEQVCASLALAIIRCQRRQQAGAPRRPSKYDGLVAEGLLTNEELEQAIQQAREDSVHVEDILARNYSIRPTQIGPCLARFFNVPYEPANPGRQRIEDLHGRLKPDFQLEHGWVPLEDGPEGLVIVCLDPEAVRGSRAVQQFFPRATRIAWRVTTQAEFAQTINQIWDAARLQQTVHQLLADMQGPLDTDPEVEDEVSETAAADNELVRFVNRMIVDAYNQRASDIHIEPLPGRGKTGIRFRIDGSLVPYVEVPPAYRQALVTRLKIMCDLDISERRKPQDGKIKFRKFGPLDIELRVATIPSAGGVEDVVMRILAAGEPIPLEQLGLTQHNLELLKSVVTKPYGLFYVCGPTGSGKTTTLHSVLKFLNTSETKIWTAEDPVEITQKGLRQVQVNHKAGIDFATVMRAFLRADPDIIMVGESRDRETVSMGIEASLTGHLVFSTLHTNSAPESVTRLLDMGMDPFSFSDALLGVLAQRLARRLCDCRESYVPTHEEMRGFISEYTLELRETDAWKVDPVGEEQKLYEDWVRTYGIGGKIHLHRAVGCSKCNGSGYRGRIGLHELLVADEEVRRLIQERARVRDILIAGVAGGMRTLKMDGMEKIMMGLTDLKQVRSVCIR